MKRVAPGEPNNNKGLGEILSPFFMSENRIPEWFKNSSAAKRPKIHHDFGKKPLGISSGTSFCNARSRSNRLLIFAINRLAESNSVTMGIEYTGWHEK